MSNDRMHDYARENVAHHTAALQAEIEALRAEVDRLSEAFRGWWKAHRPVGWTEDQHRSCPHINLATYAEKALATALLGDIHQIAGAALAGEGENDV